MGAQAVRCGKRIYGREAPCREVLVARTDHLGRVSWWCPKCARYALGVCRDCDNERAGKSPRCTSCRAERIRLQQKSYAMEDAAILRRRQTAKAWYYAAGKARREARMAAMTDDEKSAARAKQNAVARLYRARKRARGAND